MTLNFFSTSSDSEDDYLSEIVKATPGPLEGLDEDCDDMEDGINSNETPLRTKNETVEEIGPVNLIDISISETTAIEYLGTVEKVMDSIAIVKAHTSGEYRVLDEGTVIVTETRKLVGTVSSYISTYLTLRYLRLLVPLNSHAM
jgi:H/ACA ribonucleoprotein complex non-core subunit NAF1